MDKIKTLIKENYPSIIKPTVVLFCICLIIALALSLANKVTAPTIAKLEKQTQDEAMAALIEADQYNEAKTAVDGNEITYYTAETGGEIKGYLFTFAEQGYGGDINVMTAVGADGKIINISILAADDETPGLGQNVTKEAFYSQYEGKSGSVSVVKNGADSDAGEIDAVTGATISSKAVTRAVNQALEAFEAVTNGGEAE